MKVTLLPLLVNSWHLGPVLPPGVTSGSQKTGFANRNLALGLGPARLGTRWAAARCGAHRGRWTSPPVRSVENLSR